jgi:CheY-like chemotaxis protein
VISFKGKSILVADDEELIREIFVEVFSSLNAVVAEAHNGKEAFELLNTNRFDVVISDIRMPGGDGIKLLEQIQNELPYQPKIFLCSGFSDIDPATAEKLNVVKVFPKPFVVKAMVQAIAGALGCLPESSES